VIWRFYLLSDHSVDWLLDWATRSPKSLVTQKKHPQVEIPKSSVNDQRGYPWVSGYPHKSWGNIYLNSRKFWLIWGCCTPTFFRKHPYPLAPSLTFHLRRRLRTWWMRCTTWRPPAAAGPSGISCSHITEHWPCLSSSSFKFQKLRYVVCLKIEAHYPYLSRY